MPLAAELSSFARWRVGWTLLVIASLCFCGTAQSHEIRPAHLQITEREEGRYDILWKQPTMTSMALRLEPRIGGGVLDRAPTSIETAPGFQIRQWRNLDAGVGGLEGRTLEVEGLSASLTDVLVTLTRADGESSQHILHPRAPTMELHLRASHVAVPAYLALGIEHILLGVDHLAFVLGLLLLVQNRVTLIKTITAFTVAHSITLAATSLHWISVHSATVEALVALSILFVAVEVVHRHRGRTGLASRYPWRIAFLFGLLHGAAFAGALSEIGLPPDAIVAALLLFNVGVEIGQMIFIAGMLSICWALRSWLARLPLWSRAAPAYVIGSVAAFWLMTDARAAPAVATYPQREVFYGDLHLHTSYSFDAYINATHTVTPDEAYRFAKGESVEFLGEPVQRRWPLDFMAVTDHAENIGVFNGVGNPDDPIASHELGKAFRAMRAALTGSGTVDREVWGALYRYFLGSRNPLPEELLARSAAAWTHVVESANRQYQPGKFTTFIAYEWTSMPFGANLHRNVIFKSSSAPAPFTAFDSAMPEDLWQWLETIRGQGYEAIAIPHNPNSSNGLMYDWVESNSLPITRGYAERRQRNEPLSEIAQTKGASETHPLLSPSDEFANFEIYDFLAGLRGRQSELPGSYLRDALGRGLVIERRIGVNPYKYGFVGASDQHSGLSASDQADFAGSHYAINGGAGKPTRDDAAATLRDAGTALKETAGNLTAVWAERNTREGIYDALRRRETFATSGTRLKLRFFGGWSFGQSPMQRRDWIANAYARGTPMGGDMPAREPQAPGPSFLIWALKDPDGANLDRVQVVKVWAQGGVQREKVFDVVWSGDRKPDASGKLPSIGNTVDLATGAFSNSIGSAQLAALWTDPEFDARQAAAYYLRALEIPTARWSTLLALEHRLPLPENTPPTVQQRAWSSPIWYTP